MINKRGDKQRKNLLFKSKKGAEDVFYPTVIFIILNLVFFSTILVFVDRSSTGTLVYEQAYAKQIALLIDGAEPTTKIIIDFEKGIEIAKKNNVALTGIVKESNNEIIVKLSDKSGYGFKHFSKSDINFEFKENTLIITVGEQK